jgi:hypothetical protein
MKLPGRPAPTQQAKESKKLRQVPRYRLVGDAFWSTDRIEGACRVRDLSVKGAGIAEPLPDLQPGSEIVVIKDRVLPPVRARVVHQAQGLGLVFVNPSPELIEQIEELTDDLSPHTWTLVSQ